MQVPRLNLGAVGAATLTFNPDLKIKMNFNNRSIQIKQISRS